MRNLSTTDIKPATPASILQSYLSLCGAICLIVLTTGLQFLNGCARPDWFFGVGGHYNDAEMEILRGRTGNMDKAISKLEGIVKQNPTYRDSLTLLGRAYYRKGRYYDAYLVLQRAVAVNKNDEIAWLTLGISQIQIGQGERGLEVIRGALTSLNKNMAAEEYRGYSPWDQNGNVRLSLRRAVLAALKGLSESDNIVRASELLLGRIDDEVWAQRRGQVLDKFVESTGG